jgi:GntR family transcriptional regulator, transcriptional repressor for pyruvate dehydrogenase complex
MSKGLRKSPQMEWKPFKRIRQHEYVLEQIKKMITSRTLAPGDRLPSERELSAKLGVGRSAVKEAFRILEILGLIEVKIGDGSFMQRNNFSYFFESIANTIGFLSDLTPDTVLNFLEFRSVWEIKCAALAAKNATDEDIKMMQIELDRMEKAKSNPTEYKVADINFHHLMCIASKDKAIMLVVQGVRNILVSYFDVYPYIISEPERMQNSFISHQNILGAIKGHDDAKAIKFMQEHLDNARRNILGFFKQPSNVEKDKKLETLSPSKSG